MSLGRDYRRDAQERRVEYWGIFQRNSGNPRPVERLGIISDALCSILTDATYWAIGRRIVVHEQHGAERAGYGEELIVRLSRDLQSRFGRGFGRANLFQMRSFYLAYRDILQTASGESGPDSLKVQTLSGLSVESNILASITACFPLPWSHYVRLLAVRNQNARGFYAAEALRGGWTIRQLNRQIESQFYERTALSKDKPKMLRRGVVQLPADVVTPEQEIKDPYFLEFLALKDEYSETSQRPSRIPSSTATKSVWTWLSTRCARPGGRGASPWIKCTFTPESAE